MCLILYIIAQLAITPNLKTITNKPSDKLKLAGYKGSLQQYRRDVSNAVVHTKSFDVTPSG